MGSTVAKWGNSLAVRIPQSLAKEISVEEGTEIEISVVDGMILIKPTLRRHYTLDELVTGITPENLHSEVDWGVAMGNEFW
jgi:antitoxin MazE